MIVARNLLLCFALSVSATAGTLNVTSAADSGPGTLRQAILDANSGACASPCTINYGFDSVQTLAPLTELPNIDASNVTITPAPPFRSWTLEIRGSNLTFGSGLRIRGGHVRVDGLIVNGFPGSGIVVEGGDVQIGACIIGLDPTGTHAVPNRQNGITIGGGHQVTLDSNTIGGNGGNGVFASNASNLFFGGNTIGKQYLPQGSGDLALGNGASGVFLQDSGPAHFLRNVIANNGLDGIATSGASPQIVTEDAGLPNLIYDNGLMPIDVGFDGVTDAGRPRLTKADISNGFMRVTGSVSVPVTINIFASSRVNQFGIADAKTSLYATHVNAGNFELRFKLSADLTGQWISATATTDDSSSELSDPVKAEANNQDYIVSATSDSGPGSLRQAILDANAGVCSPDFPCRIVFPFPGPARVTIAPRSPLPPITRSGIIVDGGNIIEISGGATTPGPGLTISAANGALASDTIRNIAITNFDGPGIWIDARANRIDSPLIDRVTVAANHGDGILVQGNVPFVHFGTYGSSNRIQFSTISGNGGSGVRLEGGFFELDTNKITGSGAAGVDIEKEAGAHLEGNTLAFNGDVGLSIAATTAGTFKASIANAIHSNAGAAIRQTPVVQPAPEITFATYDPATQMTTVKGTFTKVPALSTTMLDVYVSTFPEVDRRGSAERSFNSQVVNDGTFSITFNRGNLGGMRVSATATPFTYQGFKGAPEPDVFGQGFEYGTTSEFSLAIPVTTIGCAADLPQIVSASPAEVRWMTVAGATSYNVWLRSVPGTPRIVGNTTADRFSFNLGAGTFEWFVEALFPQCPSAKSEAERIIVPRARPSRH